MVNKEVAGKIRGAIVERFKRTSYHDIFDLFFIEGLRMKAISKELNIPENTIKADIFRMRAFLISKFKEQVIL